VLGLELRPESYTAVATDLEGSILYSKFESAQLTGAGFRDGFLEIVARVREELRRSEVPLLGIGVGVSGVVHPEKGLIRYSIPLQLEDPFDFRGRIAQGYDLPLFLENDANACAWGELAFHRSKRLRDFLFVLAEFRDVRDRSRYHEKTAVGMGIVIGGRVHYGHSYSAGEFRSVFCTPECKGQFSLTEEEAYRIEEDPAVLSRFIRELSRNISMIANTFNLGRCSWAATSSATARKCRRCWPRKSSATGPTPTKRTAASISPRWAKRPWPMARPAWSCTAFSPEPTSPLASNGCYPTCRPCPPQKPKAVGQPARSRT
jgi:hypothetical protein